jgi:hypothetical protein
LPLWKGVLTISERLGFFASAAGPHLMTAGMPC